MGEGDGREHGPGGGEQGMVTAEEFGHFAVKALLGMAAIVEGLGDDLANRRPDLPGGNSPYALLTHCLGVVHQWCDGYVLGREVVRDRPAEFEARGDVATLTARARAVAAGLTGDVELADPRAALHGTPHVDLLGPDRTLSQGAALQHVFEELAQHHGQMQIVRDVLVAAAARS